MTFSNRGTSVLSGSQVRVDSTEVKAQAAFHGEGSSLNDIVLLSKKKCLSSLLGTIYQSCRLFQMRYIHRSPVNNVYFQIHYFIISQWIKMSLLAVKESIHLLYLLQSNRKKWVSKGLIDGDK